MSLANVLPYFRSRMDGLGYHEWEESFSADRLPDTLIDQAYFVRFGEAAALPINQSDLPMEVPVTLTVHFKGFRNEKETQEVSLAASQTILKDILKIANRTSMLTNVRAQGFSITPLNENNDRIAVVQFDFIAVFHIGIEEN